LSSSHAPWWPLRPSKRSPGRSREAAAGLQSEMTLRCADREPGRKDWQRHIRHSCLPVLDRELRAGGRSMRDPEGSTATQARLVEHVLASGFRRRSRGRSRPPAKGVAVRLRTRPTEYEFRVSDNAWGSPRSSAANFSRSSTEQHRPGRPASVSAWPWSRGSGTKRRDPVGGIRRRSGEHVRRRAAALRTR
jgi:hypothetical protein